MLMPQSFSQDLSTQMVVLCSSSVAPSDLIHVYYYHYANVLLMICNVNIIVYFYWFYLVLRMKHMFVADLPSGQVVRFLVGFKNNGEKDLTVTSMETSFRYPQDYSFYIQNVSGFKC